MYREFINLPEHRPIFQVEGTVEGDPIRDSSATYKKYFRNGIIEHLGRANRRRGLPNKVVENQSFIAFSNKQNLKINYSHKTIVKSIEGEYKSASKYAKAQPIVDEQAFAMSMEWTKRHFGPGIMMGSKVVSKETALKEMDANTAAGFPHSMKYVKKSLMYKDTRHMGIVDSYFSMIQRNQDKQEWFPIWSCSEKVELRPLEKILENSIRTFTASPIEHSVALNRLCLDMNNKFYSANGKTWSYVGGNKFMCGFHELHRRLSKHPNAFELDESQFDSSLFARLLYDQGEMRFTFLRKEEQTQEMRNAMRNLYDSIINSVIVMQNGELIRKFTGNPSGSANTIVDNTMILFRLFAYAWIVLAKEKFGSTNAAVRDMALDADVELRNYGATFGNYNDFMIHIEAALNGDDNTFTASDEVVDWFNPTTIAPLWSGLGITTNTPNDSKGQRVEQVRFLSQGFTLIGNKWLPTPETNKVLSSIMYGSDTDDPMWHLLRANALRVDTWANVECRTIIQMYIEYLMQEYNDQYWHNKLVGKQGSEVEMKDIRAMYKSDEWIWRLYTNHEGGNPQLSAEVDQSEENFSTTNTLKLISKCLHEEQILDL